MSEVVVKADLGGSPIGESMTIVVTGAPCRLREAREEIVDLLKRHRARHVASDQPAKPVRPCGCQEKGAGQR